MPDLSPQERADAEAELAEARKVADGAIDAASRILDRENQALGHTRERALSGGCLCRWCGWHRARAAYDTHKAGEER